ncbi:SDR family NAD(P)-dependent oxidoreductase [Nocardioides limicola]|uniref:SDR family NAD(P)-dependent oxidoreductase n=1 Tax=Nocardioides limicola TaxID=2803368 RepID=UPI00193BC0AE|nr:SDR family NAD(P)-dependent oxidoreductase [Nocardioides sp. DJM-14]
MSPDRGLDRLLDRSVVLGYTSWGLRLRRRSWQPDDPAPDALAGRRALVTGAGSGLGEATALGLARLGATVHLLVRSADRARPAVARIGQALAADGLPSRVQVEACDVSDLASVRRFADGFTLPLDVLIHNAGVMPAARTTSAQGHELTLATHVLGPVLMTELLQPALRASETGARVVFVSSGGMYTQRLDAADPEFENGRYRGSVAYARSKRLQVALTPLLARRWPTAVYAMHPGWVDTPGVAQSLPVFRAVTRPLLRTAEQGADTTVWLAATEPAPPAGTFWHDRQQRPAHYRRSTHSTAAEVEDVWRQVAEATGLPPAGKA